MFFKLIFYKFYKGIERVSKGDEEHCASNAITFLSLFLFFNTLFVFFSVSNFLSLGTDSPYVRIGLVVFLIIVWSIVNKKVFKSGKYRFYIEDVAKSELKGRKGNIIVISYILLTFLSMILLVIYMLSKIETQ